MTRTPVRRRSAAVLVATAAWLGVPGTALAHSTLTGSEPAGGAVLSTAPARVHLVFDQPLSPKYGVVTVTGPGGQVQRGSTEVHGVDVTQALEPVTQPGRYRVSYRLAASGDAHPVVGALHFDVTTGSDPATGAQVVDATPQDVGRPVRSVGLALGAVGLLLAVVGWRARRPEVEV